MGVKIALVVAVAQNGVIGRNNALPWRISADLSRFKEITIGHPVIMGRRTFESIGRPLPHRKNIVLSRSGRIHHGTYSAATFGEAISEAAKTEGDSGTAMVIGGADVFALAMPSASRIYLTEVHQDVEGDVFFPGFDRAEWRETLRQDEPAAGDTPAFSFVILDRI